LIVFRSETGFEESQLKLIQSEESQDSLEDGKESEEENDDESNKIKEEDTKAVQVSSVISENVGILIVPWF
jgi:hypothetical protein